MALSPIEELLEIEAIKKLRILYSHYFDGGKTNKLVDLFADDVVCEFGPNYGGDWVGKEAIRAGYAITAPANRSPVRCTRTRTLGSSSPARPPPRAAGTCSTSS